MYRDFSEQSKQNLLGLVDEVESEKWSGITDWFGDRWYDFQDWIGALDIKKYTDNIDAYHKKVIDKNNASKKAIEDIFEEVSVQDELYGGKFRSDAALLLQLDRYLAELAETILPNSGRMNALTLRLPLTAAWQAYQSQLKNAHVRHPYDEDSAGQYGGNQGAPQYASQAEQDAMYEIFQKNNPSVNLNAEQRRNLFRRLNSEGCGYVSLVNTIFCEYYLREEEFEKTFGYPMYDEKGNLNFNLLLMDIYSRMDNRNARGKYDAYNDYDPNDEDKNIAKKDYSVWDDKSGRGTTQEQREYYIEQFMKEHGVKADLQTNVKVTVDNYADIVASGKQVLISFRYGNLRDEDGNVHYINGGHSMVVTGVTEDGRFIVSSWGKKYYIDPNEIFTREIDGKKHTTSMTFETVKYN